MECRGPRLTAAWPSRPAALLVLLVALLGSFASLATESGFARRAVSACSDKDSLPIRFPSPDGTKAVTVELADGYTQAYLVVDGARYRVDAAAWPCPEYQWSSDSRAFFVNYSEGGAVGRHEVTIFYASRNGVRSVDPRPFVRKDSRASYPKCFEQEDANLAGIAWLDGSRRLLVAAEVLPHSNCDSSGTFWVYEVEVSSGKVLRKWNQLEAKARFWEQLGDELRAANDECIRRPKACEVPTLHERR